MATRKPKTSPIKLIHTLKGALGLDEETYRATLAGYGVASSKDLRPAQAALLIRDLEQKAVAAGVWKTKNPPQAGKRPAKVERNLQMSKIEALLTVGGKPWGYADALAQRICKVNLVVWVPDGDLYKIITALRKQAQREGWDLSGENR